MSMTQQELSDYFLNNSDCTDCKIKCENSSANFVYPVKIGSPRLMIVGEGPGADEDRLQKPFVGKSGELLQDMLCRLNTTDEIYITNVVKHRPKNNRKPTDQEAETCANTFLKEEILTFNPEVIVALGRTAAETLMKLAGRQKKGSLRGHVFGYEYGPYASTVYCTWHPAYILRNQTKEPELFEDLLKACSILKL